MAAAPVPAPTFPFSDGYRGTDARSLPSLNSPAAEPHGSTPRGGLEEASAPQVPHIAHTNMHDSSMQLCVKHSHKALGTNQLSTESTQHGSM